VFDRDPPEEMDGWMDGCILYVCMYVYIYVCMYIYVDESYLKKQGDSSLIQGVLFVFACVDAMEWAVL
jgi:hypothetical protein